MSFTAVLNQFIFKLDNRYDKNKKPGTGSTVKRERVTGLPSTSQPPPSLPAWMIDPNYKLPATVMMAGPSEVPEGTASECTVGPMCSPGNQLHSALYPS